VAEPAGPWQASRESALRQRCGGGRLRADGAGRRHELVFTDRVLVTLAVLRLQIPHAALAVMFGVDRYARDILDSVITRHRGSHGRDAGRPEE